MCYMLCILCRVFYTNPMRLLKIIFRSLLYIFAVIGLVLVGGYFAVKWGLTNDPGIDRQDDFFQKSQSGSNAEVEGRNNLWSKGEEWVVFKKAVKKDKSAIEKAAAESQVPPRIIVSILGVEQLRLYHTNREIFKQFFAPLKLLGKIGRAHV